jgi:hypothetical protein
MAVENPITKAVATIKESTDNAYGDKYDIGHAAAPLCLLKTPAGRAGVEICVS